MKKTFPASELIINADGSVFHLHVRPEQLADKIILCGDPGRVDTIAAHFDIQECDIQSREFLKNIDFETHTEKEQLTSLEIVRIGTTGGLQPYTPIGTFIISEKSIGFDGLLNFYGGRDEVCDLEFEKAFTEHMHWNHRLLHAPYVIDNSKELIDRIYSPEQGMVKGVTIACGGFYGPQGRQLRIPLADPQQNEKVESFEYNGYRITNFEMESSAIAGLAALLGHRAMTVCMVIANRRALEANTGYKNQIDDLIRIVLDKI